MSIAAISVCNYLPLGKPTKGLKLNDWFSREHLE